MAYENLPADIDKFITATAQANRIVNGPATGPESQVQTDNGLVSTFARVLAGVESGSRQFDLLSQLQAVAGSAEGQIAYVTEDTAVKNGMYAWSGTAWLKKQDLQTAEKNAQNPVFVPGTRSGITSAAPTTAMAFIYDIMIHGARRNKEYHVDYIQNQSSSITPVTDGITIMEYDAGTWDNPVQAIGRTLPVTINRDTDKQFIRIESSSGLSVSLLINPKALPPIGTAIRMSASVDAGYSWKISPTRYQYEAQTEETESGDIQIEGMGGDAVFATFNRDSVHDFEVLMMPNGSNGLFNFRSTYAINRDTGERTELMQTNSDMVPPMQLLSNESNVDTIPSDQPQTGYTGGNHTSDGNTGGTPTAMMASIEHYMDGVKIDAGESFKSGASEYRIRWINKVMAWNTKELGRYVLDQIVTAVIRKGTVEIWCKVVALENITVSVDNGLQSFAAGFDNILFYNGANKTSRVAITSGLTSGQAAGTGAGAGCFAASLKGSAAAGLQTVWYDRNFGVGDGSHIGGTAGRFRVNGGKVYGAAITSNRPITLAPGESYEWHMGISWSGLEGFDGIDSAVRAYVNNEPVLMYAKLNSGLGSIKASEGSVINDQAVGSSGYWSNEAAGAYMYAIDSRQSLALVKKAVAEANAFTDAKANLSSNLEKYGVANPLRVYKAGDRSGLLALYYDRADVDGVIRLTPTGSAGTGYARIDISSENLDPKNLIFRYRIKKLSGSEPNYVLSVSSAGSTSNLYGPQKRVSADGLFFTYEVDISRRPDGSPWPVGDKVTSVAISLSTVAAGDTSSVYELEFLSYGYRAETPIRYTTEGGFDGSYFAPLRDNTASIGTASRRPTQLYAITSTIGVSDKREKQQIRELSEAENAVAVKLKALIRAFKFNDAVALKGDGARIHFGVIAQDVKAAFESEGLVAEDYAILCHDVWGGEDAILDEDGNVIQEATPSQDRYGVRYEELLAFIISAM